MKYMCTKCKMESEIPDCVTCGTWKCATCGTVNEIGSNVPETESGDDWNGCPEYTGPGAKDPTGGKLPQGWHIADLISAVKLKRGKKIITIKSDEEGNLPVKKGDMVIKAIMDEDLIGELYEGDSDAILLSDAKGRMEWTRLGWYKDFGRDGLRVWATGEIRRKIAGPGVVVG
jgi:hypothetical protein